MTCSHCGFENLPDARFCENCGEPLERLCPNCGNRVSATARFCSHCGFKLTAGEPAAPASRAATYEAASAASAALDSLRRAAPPTLAQKILAERERLEGERKLVTALFADVVGSTALAEAMDPEEWREVVSGVHERVSRAVYRYEGTIAQLLGDGVLAFFGAPLAHEDDAERAVRAALDILVSIREYANGLATRGLGAMLQMRLGLNTGIVVVGNIGSDLHMEYLAIGDTVNLAARIQSAAEPDTILISESTYRHAVSLFDFEDRGAISVKGKTEPVQVYRVLAERKGAVRARGIAGLSSPMVGREREFSTLMQVVRDLRMGRGAIVSVIGEAGLGKSRLVAEWRKAVRNENSEAPIRWREGRSLSYASAVAYHLGTDVLRALLDVPADAGDQQLHAALRDKIREHLGAGEEARDAYASLGHMLGLPLEDEAAARVAHLDGPALQAHYVSAFRALVVSVARTAPTIIVAEDIHWADPSSVELGSRILPLAAEVPVAFVLVTRPDPRSAGWRLVTEARQVPGVSAVELHLSPLTENDSDRLFSNLLEVAALPRDVRDVILAKAEGNPFFVEEVIRMLIDRGDLQRHNGSWVAADGLGAIEIPDTLQAVITARIDRLPEDAKRVLQVAAVIGRRFQVSILETVMQGARGV
jgi:class 3 adenylate cyclase